MTMTEGQVLSDAGELVTNLAASLADEDMTPTARLIALDEMRRIYEKSALIIETMIYKGRNGVVH